MILLKPQLNFKIETRSTIIKPIVIDQISEEYVSWLNNTNLNKYLEVRHNLQSKQTIIDYINSLRQKHNCDLFAIVNKSSKKHIGNLTISSFNNNNNSTVDFGIMIADKDARLIGVGAEIHLATLKLMFGFNEINRMNANAASLNLLACKTLLSLGYKQEGVKRQSFYLNATNSYCDTIMFGLLRDEWEALQLKFIKLIEIININKL